MTLGVRAHSDSDLIETLTALNQIDETLNRAVDVRSVLDQALARLIELMGLETGWIALREHTDRDHMGEAPFSLAAQYHLPPALDRGDADPWAGSCTCQRLCGEGRLTEAYNEVRCSRLSTAGADGHGLAVHASVPLRSGDQTLGILNVAAADWSSFSQQALALLTNVGNHIGVALERARLYDLVQERRVQEQAVLLDLSNRLLSRQALPDLIDQLVDEVHRTLQVDACALLLLNETGDRLLFQTATGWRTDPVAAGHEVPLDHMSDLGRVLSTQSPVVTEDLQALTAEAWDPTWLLTEGFRGHAEVPLVVNGHAIGVLVIDQRQPLRLSQNEVRLLRLMANQAAVAIEKARLQEEEIRMQTLERELQVAREIQLSLLPRDIPVHSGWEFGVYYEAAREVGGDFYDLISFPEKPERVGLVIGDVTGKGVPAALFMARTSTLIRAAARYGLGPAAALLEINEFLSEANDAAPLVTALYASLDTQTGRLTYANAGHNRPLKLFGGQSCCEELNARGMLLGAVSPIELEERIVDLAPGDMVILYTDGVTEAMDAQGRPFGEERLHALLADCSGASTRQVIDSVVAAVQAHTGDLPPSDDVTLLVIKRAGP